MIKNFSLFFFTEFNGKLRLLGESTHNYTSQTWQVSDEFRCTEILLLFRILLFYTNTKLVPFSYEGWTTLQCICFSIFKDGLN